MVHTAKWEDFFPSIIKAGFASSQPGRTQSKHPSLKVSIRELQHKQKVYTTLKH